jgi:hypothetical protein
VTSLSPSGAYSAAAGAASSAHDYPCT